ncbi:MAG: hypothetical protein PHT34_02930, partial [Oscillospiraceae bacterium]|nr:hypothetical protein [Oscillospiraceae bacterium]
MKGLNQLESSVRFIKGIGAEKAKTLSKLGIQTVYDLISYFPQRYEDRTQFKSIS